MKPPAKQFPKALLSRMANGSADPVGEVMDVWAKRTGFRIIVPPIATQKKIVGNFHGQLHSELDRKRAAYAFALKTAPKVAAARKALDTAERKAGSTWICRYLTAERVPLPRSKPGKLPSWSDGQFNDMLSAADKLKPAVVRHYRDEAHRMRLSFDPISRYDDAGSPENLCVREVADAIALNRWINGWAGPIETQDRAALLNEALADTIAIVESLEMRIPKQISDNMWLEPFGSGEPETG